MRRKLALVVPLAFVVALDEGCTLTEVRSKQEYSVEWRQKSSSRAHDERYSVKQGLQFKWSNGWDTGIAYRHRDVNDGGGEGENGLWLDVSFPLWKAPSDKSRPSNLDMAAIRELEHRLEELEKQVGKDKAS
ncbi:MAG: hypothetical protein AB7N71_04880 [Phycisphaerae bacterium]